MQTWAMSYYCSPAKILMSLPPDIDIQNIVNVQIMAQSLDLTRTEASRQEDKQKIISEVGGRQMIISDLDFPLHSSSNVPMYQQSHQHDLSQLNTRIVKCHRNGEPEHSIKEGMQDAVQHGLQSWDSANSAAHDISQARHRSCRR